MPSFDQEEGNDFGFSRWLLEIEGQPPAALPATRASRPPTLSASSVTPSLSSTLHESLFATARRQTGIVMYSHAGIEDGTL